MFRYFTNMIVLVFVCLCSMSLTTRHLVGANYSFYKHTNNFHPVYTLNTSLPCPQNLTVKGINSTSILVSWIPPDQSVRDKYSFNYEYMYRFKRHKARTWEKDIITDTKLMLTNLSPGENYTIEISSLFPTGSKTYYDYSPRTINWVTPPKTVENVVALSSERVITSKFTKPGGQFDFNLETKDVVNEQNIQNEESINVDNPTLPSPRVTRSESGETCPFRPELYLTEITNSSVRLSWKDEDTEKIKKLQQNCKYEITYDNITIPTNNLSVLITGLAPYHNYTFSLSGISNTIVNTTIQTLESPPGNFSVFNVTNINPTDISFAWHLPDQEKHGVITKFIIFFNSTNIFDREIFDAGASQGRVPRLKPNTVYTFKLSAVNSKGSNEISLVKQTAPDRPPQTQASPDPMTSATTSTIKVRFNENYFSKENGPILSYTVIVAEDPPSSVETESYLPSWNDVQSKMPWPPYQVLEPNKLFFNSSPVVEYTIGVEKCPNGVRYCNGPLKSGTSYRVKLRAFTSPTLFTDTPYSVPISTNTSYTLLIVFSLVLVIVFILFLGILILSAPILKEYLYGQSSAGSDNLPLQNFSLPILVEHFKTMIINRDRMLEEFESLKRVGVNQSTEEGELDCNRPKNRFSNILPYDNSRYKLQPVDDEEGSDYVNASYVPGHLSPRQYIATQGPLVGTCDEFWRLCWESSTPAIVMLTQCVELGRDKCHRYWPIGLGTMQFGTITVCLKDVTHYTGWSLSELVLTRGENRRTVFHFHFTSWPDHGVPQAQDTLARFVFEFRQRIKPDQNPVVVHCSAGVGRTGTFIAIDTVLQQLDKLGDAGSVDILGMVCRLRQARKQMVQTVEQYECIYQSVQLVLQGLSYVPDTQLKQSEACEQDEGVDDL